MAKLNDVFSITIVALTLSVQSMSMIVKRQAEGQPPAGPPPGIPADAPSGPEAFSSSGECPSRATLQTFDREKVTLAFYILMNLKDTKSPYLNIL